MSPHPSPRLVVMSMALLFVAGVGATQATVASQKTKPAAAEPGKKTPGKVTFREAPSAEKPADRARRLKRECKGRPNAGMCLGHAS